MNRLFSYLLAALIGAAIATLVFFTIGREHEARQTVTVAETVSIDTVRTVAPQPMELLSVRFERVRLPSLGETKLSFNSIDRVMADSVTVAVPIETRVFSDDSTYRAVISGFHASLDTIEIYNRKVERTVSFTPGVKKPRRWGISVGVGAVATPSGRIEPGIFAGVSYQFVSF